MCGLVGYITGWTNGFISSECDAFQQLLFFDLLRGVDATGVSLINMNGEAHTYKAALPSSNYLGQEEIKKFAVEWKKTGKALLGHNRKKTSGDNSDEHAHPFIIDGRYIFFHNGSLRNHRQLHNCDLDSEALAYHFTKCEGDKEALEEACSKVEGAYACVWYDQVKHTIYFLRNKERPLAIATIDNNGGFAYASEMWMLKGILARNNLKIKSVVEIADEVLFKIDLSDPPIRVVSEPLNIKKSHPPVSHHGTGTFGGVKITGNIATSLPVLTKKEASVTLIGMPAEGETVSWYIDDYMETSVGPARIDSTKPLDFMCWGTAKTYPGVLFKGVFKDISLEDLYDICSNEIVSTIISKQYDKQKRYVECYTKNLTAVKQNAIQITH